MASREWMERSLLGGAEPLFSSLHFRCICRGAKAALAACLTSSFTRDDRSPTGIFALVGIGIALLVKRDFRRFIAAVLIGATIGLLYILPLMFYLGNPLANVKGYDQADWNGGVPLTIPLVAIAEDALAGRATKLNLARTGLWIVVILVSTAVILGKRTLLIPAEVSCGRSVLCVLRVPLVYLQLLLGESRVSAVCHSYSPICNSGFASLDSESTHVCSGHLDYSRLRCQRLKPSGLCKRLK